MAETTRHDAWQAGDGYERYMGRWSRQIAPRFLDWLEQPSGLDWLDIGCGTGVLSHAILVRSRPDSLISVDPSEGFLASARQTLQDPRVKVAVGDAMALPLEATSRDVVVSALVLNFVSDRPKALCEMQRVARPGGCVGFYVWDYPGAGVEFMRAFWQAASALDPAAAELSEGRRFPFCTPDGLRQLAQAAGLRSIEVVPIEMPSVFKDFDDYWLPFTLGAGPAPGYCVSLSPEARECLRERLFATLPRQPDGSIRMNTRAWALKSTAG